MPNLTRDETDRRAATETNNQLARIAEQERIAAVLADTMARRLFTIGLQLSGVLKLATSQELHRRITEAVDETDRAITELRRAVSTLTGTRGGGSNPDAARCSTAGLARLRHQFRRHQFWRRRRGLAHHHGPVGPGAAQLGKRYPHEAVPFGCLAIGTQRQGAQ